MKIKWTIAIILIVMVSNALADDDGEVLQRLKAKYPKTQFTSVQKSQFNGLFEIIMGKNVEKNQKGLPKALTAIFFAVTASI